jgi:hypothetical protein
VLVVIGVSGATATIKIKWVIKLHRKFCSLISKVVHCPFTLTWVIAIVSGVPVGTQIAWLS